MIQEFSKNRRAKINRKISLETTAAQIGKSKSLEHCQSISRGKLGKIIGPHSQVRRRAISVGVRLAWATVHANPTKWMDRGR